MARLDLGVPRAALVRAAAGRRELGPIRGNAGSIVMSGLGHGVLVLDVFGVATALLAAWWWYLAGTRRLRRVSRWETLDAADINRIVTAINRGNILSCRAALAAATSALCVALRFAVDLISLW